MNESGENREPGILWDRFRLYRDKIDTFIKENHLVIVQANNFLNRYRSNPGSLPDFSKWEKLATLPEEIQRQFDQAEKIPDEFSEDKELFLRGLVEDEFPAKFAELQSLFEELVHGTNK